ncbi:MAG: hypothetical protein AAFX00_07725 [Pseudomonadota bacterium]
MGKVKFWALVLSGFVWANYAHACFAPPAEYTKHHTELVRDTSRIVLARVTGPSGESRDVWGRQEQLAGFEKIEDLKGNVPDFFTIENGFFVSGQPVPEQDFDGHSQLGFWEKKVTRQWNMPDCAMRPAFLQNRTYLLFMDTPHWRAYEEVSSEDDLWIGAVRRLIADPDLDTGLNLSAEEWLSMAHGVFLSEVLDCSGPTLQVKKVFSGEFEDRWPYTDNQRSQYWPFEECAVGAGYLVVTMADEQSPLPFYSSSVFEVSNNAVDFSLRRGSEIELTPSKLTLDMIEEALR